MSFKQSFALVTALALGACTTVNHSNIQASNRFHRNIALGMTKEEIRSATGTDVGNCRGSPNALEQCEVTFLTSTDHSLGSDFNSASPTGEVLSGSYQRDHRDTYLLTFDHGKLKHMAEGHAASSTAIEKTTPATRQ